MSRPLYKSVIVIWSEYDPSYTELEDLARDAVSGDSYCATSKSVRVENPEADPDWDGTEFFGTNDESDEATDE